MQCRKNISESHVQNTLTIVPNLICDPNMIRSGWGLPRKITQNMITPVPPEMEDA